MKNFNGIMGNYLYQSYLLSYLLYEVFLKTLDASATQYLQEGETNNWLEVSAKVGLGNLLNYSHNFWTTLVNKDRYIKMGNSMTHFLNVWVNAL